MAALVAEYMSATTYSSRILSSNDKSKYTEVEIDLRDPSQSKSMITYLNEYHLVARMAALVAEYMSATTYSSRILSSNDKSIYTEVEIDLRDPLQSKSMITNKYNLMNCFLY